MKNEQRREVFRAKCLSRWLGLSVSILLFLANIPIASSQPAGDPTTDPVPFFDLNNQAKSMRILLRFHDMYTAEVESVQVVKGGTPVMGTEPPLLRVKLLGLENNVLEELNAWHPMWGLAQDRRMLIPEARGEIFLPFRPDVAKMQVHDIVANLPVITTDLVSPLHGYCREHPQDPQCANVVNRPPVCNAGGPYLVECAGSSTPLTLDGKNSNDPDNDPLSWVWSGTFSGGAATGSSPTVQYSLLGTSSLVLTVMDDFALQSSCTSQVTVQDTTPPVISSNAKATIYPPDAPISFTATASDTCSPILAVEVTDYKCEMITSKKPRPIDKRESCVVQISGPTITILDSGGVGDRISWTVLARDPSGNVAQTSFYVDVIKPPVP